MRPRRGAAARLAGWGWVARPPRPATGPRQRGPGAAGARRPSGGRARAYRRWPAPRGHVEAEEGVPVEELQQDPGAEQAKDGAPAGDSNPDPDGPWPFRLGERGRDHREGGGHDRGRAHAHEHPDHDEVRGVGGDHPDGGRGAEDDQADEEQALATVTVPEDAGEEQQPGEDHGVGVDDPGEPGLAGSSVPGQAGQGQIEAADGRDDGHQGDDHDGEDGAGPPGRHRGGRVLHRNTALEAGWTRGWCCTSSAPSRSCSPRWSSSPSTPRPPSTRSLRRGAGARAARGGVHPRPPRQLRGAQDGHRPDPGGGVRGGGRRDDPGTGGPAVAPASCLPGGAGPAGASRQPGRLPDRRARHGPPRRGAHSAHDGVPRRAHRRPGTSLRPLSHGSARP